MDLNRAGRILHEALDTDLAEDWDNPGWSVAQLKDELTGILLCVDPSEEAIDKAIENNLNLVISHHPLILNSIDSVVDDEPQKRIIIKALRNDIAIYGAHTNVDSMSGGLNDEFVKLFKLTKPEPIDPHPADETAGLGRVGSLHETATLESVESKLRDHLDLTKIESLGSPNLEVQTLAVCTGSGGDFITHPRVQQADLFITADVDHHEAMAARQSDLALINLDHYEMESVFIPVVNEICQQRFDDDLPIRNFYRENPYRRQCREDTLN